MSDSQVSKRGPFRAAWDVNHHLAQGPCAVHTSAQQSLGCRRDRQGTAVPGFRSPSSYLTPAPKAPPWSGAEDALGTGRQAFTVPRPRAQRERGTARRLREAAPT